jgi:antigen flippase
MSVPASTSEWPAAPVEERSYRQILKSSALIGGSSIVAIAIGMVRTKAMAVLLGPAGFGLMGLYTSIADFTRSVAEFGINGSGVRQIAEAAGSGEEERIARTAFVLRRTAVVLGLIGAGMLVAFSGLASQLTFGDEGRAGAVAVLGLAVFFRLVADGQGALIQGMRRIGDLAKMGIFGAIFGAIASVALVYLLGEDGVEFAVVAVAATGLAFSWWYSRKLEVCAPKMSIADVREEASALLKLGFAFMASGILMMGASYAVRTIVLRTEGLDAAGLYSAAWTFAGLYVNIILQSMGADFYPRLVAAVNDHPKCNRLVNEQTAVSLLLAGPGVIATLTFAPIVIPLFYSAEFADAAEVLRWICLGIAIRVITWPIGYIIVAKNNRLIFLATEVAWTAVNVGLTWACVTAFGLNGAGIAFFASYVFHGIMIYPIVRSISGFSWTYDNIKLGGLMLMSVSVVFIVCLQFSFWTQVIVGCSFLVATGAYSLLSLAKTTESTTFPRVLRRLALARRRISN